MSIELRPLGVKCNIACQYCYQHPQRDVEEKTKPYDMNAMKAAILREGGSFTLFGGEALLLPLDDLEALWSWGLEKFGQNAVQTNATLVTEKHIELFKKYKVSIGVSMDGPGELNDVRWAGSLERTRSMTRKSQEGLEMLCREGLEPGLIVTLHRGNATPEKLPRMGEWFRQLDELGVASARLHLLEVENESIRQKYPLTIQENVEALLYFSSMESSMKTLRFDIFKEIEALQHGNDDRATCTWTACDPYTTAAVRGVEGQGQRSNCGRSNKEGIDFVKASVPGYMRYVSLYHTPQEYGGCKGCRFFVMCKGHCPGTALEGDWRNRTEHCEVWKTFFSFAEEKMLQEGKTPLSRHPILPKLENALIRAWSEGENRSLHSLILNINQTETAPEHAVAFYG